MASSKEIEDFKAKCVAVGLEIPECLLPAPKPSEVDTSDVTEIRGKAGFITFVMKDGIYFVMPRLYPETCAAVAEILKKGSPSRHQLKVDVR